MSDRDELVALIRRMRDDAVANGDFQDAADLDAALRADLPDDMLACLAEEDDRG